jgi:pyruvate dehydrogenase E2 component (dihydrolipoamide acetyltransferase)
MAEQLVMLALSPTMETAVIARWNKQEGDSIAAGDVVCEVETDKAVMEYESPTDGVLLKILVNEGGKAAVGEPIGIVGEEGEDISELLEEVEKKAPEPAPEPSEEAPAPTTVMTTGPSAPPSDEAASPVPQEQVPTFRREQEGKIRSSPVARKLASHAGLELGAITGSGPAGRIVKRDVERAIQQRAAAPEGEAAPTVSPEEGEAIRVTERRRVIAQRMAASKSSAPHYYLTLSVSMDNILDERRAHNEASDENLSLNAFLIKLVAEALKRHPMVNASWNGTTITLHKRIDISVAVAHEDGLIAPIVRDCGSRGIRAIDADLRAVVEKARANKLSVEDYEGGTFTLSNLGTYGIEEFTAIINPPQSAILAVGAITKTPVVGDDGRVIARHLMKMTLSCDHRVIDGAVGAEFLRDLKSVMESPIRALL